MFSVGVRCVSQVPSTREANSYFEEEMASTFVEEKSVDIHFCQWLVSISLHSTLASNISTMCAHRSRLTFLIQLQNNNVSLLVTVKSALRACSETKQDAYVLS